MTNALAQIKSGKGYLAAVGGVTLFTMALAPFQATMNSTTVALLLLLVVLSVATIYGSRPAFLASVLGVLSFNFFFLPPLYTFTIADPQNWVAFGAFLVTALIAGQLSSYARRQTRESESRRQEIEGLYLKLQAAFEQASKAEAYRQGEQLKSALLDAVTHDLRTPLTSIKASATILMEDAIISDKESRNELLEVITEETDRLNDFIGGMVELARIEAGKMNLRKSWSEINEMITRAIERAELRLANHRIKIELERELPSVRVDAHAVEEVIYTLLDNAAKYSPAESEIRIAAKRGENDMLELSVEDKGGGVKPEDRERIFDKFYRAAGNNSPSSENGLGLGLAIAKGITESQGGQISVENGRDGFVTRFVFTIPVGDDEVSAEARV